MKTLQDFVREEMNGVMQNACKKYGEYIAGECKNWERNMKTACAAFGTAQGLWMNADTKGRFESFKEAADNGYAPALYELGICYRDGKGTAENKDKAEKCFGQAIQKGYIPAHYALCVNNLKHDREKCSDIVQKFIDSLLKGMEQVYTLAQIEVAQQNQGGGFDNCKALADIGYAPAIFSLGTQYLGDLAHNGDDAQCNVLDDEGDEIVQD